MAASTLPVFTPTAYTQVAAQFYAKAVKFPLVGGETTALITVLGLPVVVAAATPAASTTATAAAGATTITLASGTSVALGQLIVGVGIAPGTTLIAGAGTSWTLSQPATAALSGTAVDLLASITNSGGVMVNQNSPLALGIGSNTYLIYLSQSGGYPTYGALGNTQGLVAQQAPQAQINVAVGS